MIEFFRFFRLGIVNLIGITFPGFLIFSFLAIGVVPITVLILHIEYSLFAGMPTNVLENVSSIISTNKSIVVFLTVIFSYIIGSIIRLSTPDDLDKVSANKVLKKMAKEKKTTEEEAAKKDHWPFRGEEGDKFPYFYFDDYLKHRKLADLADLVEWGKPEDDSTRTKTLVNMMKLEISYNSPELAAVIESNEAHVRLSFGIWLAVKTSMNFVILGFLACIMGIYLISTLGTDPINQAGSIYFLFAVINSILLISMLWARNRIENLFHYQRVRELTHIVGCKFYLQAGKFSQE